MLPKIELPIFEVKLPSSAKKLKVRPFKVKEEKLLLMAIESNDDNEILDATKQVINNCVIDDKFDIDSLPFFDADYLFIVLRAKSVGESVDIKFTCNNSTDSGICGQEFSSKIDILNCKIQKDESIKSDIVLQGNITVKMRYPSYTAMKSLMEGEETDNYSRKIEIIMECIEMVVDKDSVHTRKDFTKEELREFIENLSKENFSRLEKFIDNFPNFVVTSKAKCPKCKFTHNIEYSEFESFFV
jgi:hypothetical protein